MPNLPNLPKVELPSVPIPHIPGSQKNSTSYSMDNTNLENARESVEPDNDNHAAFNDEEQEDRAHLNQARHERTWEEKEKEESFALEEDTLSLLYLCDYVSITFVLSVGVFLLQLFVLVLILADLTRDAPRYPEIVFFPIEVPIDVPVQVVVAQFVSLLIAIVKEENLFYSLKAIVIVGHDERVSVRFPGATPFKWWLANSFRFISGVGNIMVSFYFIMGAKEVLEIFENFAAMEFVSYIDKIVFKLANWGYMGKPLQRMTIKLESVNMENRREKGRWWAALTVVGVCLTLIPLIVFWAKIRMGQSSGFYLEQSVADSVVVRFGDNKFVLQDAGVIEFDLDQSKRNLTSFNQTFPPELHYAYFSGSYKVAHDPKGKLFRYGGRPVYFERYEEMCWDEPTCGMFYYCKNLETWVFTIRAMGSARKELDQCEEGWLAQSEKTEAYGLEDVNDATWKVYTGVMTETTVFIKSDSCDLDSDCSLNGKCVDGTCDCFSNWQGRYCDVRKPFCPAVLFVNYGASSYDYDYLQAYELVYNDDGSETKVYERPVYYRSYNVDTTRCPSGRPQLYEIYMYAGRRWYLSFWCETDLSRYVQEDGVLQIGELLHAFWDHTTGMDIKLYSELTNSYSGRGLTMYEVRDSYSLGSMTDQGFAFESEGSFECLDAACLQDKAVCGRKGNCEPYSIKSETENKTYSWHTCKCRDYYGGPYCQFSPYEHYTREHFQQFLADPTATPQTLYQTSFWDPWLKETGGSFSPSESVGVGASGDIVPEEANANTTTAPPETETESPTTGSPIPTTLGNIFTNQSGTGT